MGACNRPACECVVGCAVLVLQARPEVSNGCLQLFVGPPFISSRAVPVSWTAARLLRFSQNHSPTHRQTCLSHLAPSRRIQRSAIPKSCRRPPTAEFSKTTYIRIQLPIRLSVLSQQPVAGLSCVVYQACPRSRPTVQATARLQKPAPPRNPGSTPLSDKALDEDDTALEAASSVPPSLQRPVSPARPCPPSLWHTGTQESLVPGPDAWSPAAGSGKISGIRFSFAQSDLIYPWKPLPTHTHTHTHTYTTPPPGFPNSPFLLHDHLHSSGLARRRKITIFTAAIEFPSLDLNQCWAVARTSPATFINAGRDCLRARHAASSKGHHQEAHPRPPRGEEAQALEIVILGGVSLDI